MTILAPISIGELIDKITILEIKKSKFKDPVKLANVTHELEELNKLLVFPVEEIEEFRKRLKFVNETLWSAEEQIRQKQSVKDQLGLSVIIRRFNEYRAVLKHNINEKFSSDIIEEKEY